MARMLAARIRFRLPGEGGRQTRSVPGLRPQLKLGDVYTSCVVHSDTEQVFEPGRDYDVTLEIIFWDEYGHLWQPGMPVELFEGSNLIATGEFTGGGGLSGRSERRRR